MKKLYFIIIFGVLFAFFSHASSLNVAIVWHHHQPDYNLDGIYQAPWVRLHSIKDYVYMVDVIQDYPGIKLNINMVPSLLSQIEDYVFNDAEDIFTILMQKNPENFTYTEKKFILERAFDAHRENVIFKIPPYLKFLEKRGMNNSEVDEKIISRFSSQDLRDLLVWFNLAWFNPELRHKVDRLWQKEKNFNDDDIKELLHIQKKIMASIIPLHRKLQNRGRIEIMATPFFHPILPLIYDNSIAQKSYPGMKLPEKYSEPESAHAHLSQALEFHTVRFGKRPAGMWPAEGSVSKDTIDLYAQENVSFLLTGDEVLSRSTGENFSRDNNGVPQNASSLYKPYVVKGNNKEVNIFFRDSILSDNLGFEYAQMSSKEAVAEFAETLYSIKESLDNPEEHIITIVLDGENAWQNYEKNGIYFFKEFYSFLSNDDNFQTVLLSDYLKSSPKKGVIKELWPGSWINADFAIWIGEEESNVAWNYLKEAREVVNSVFYRLSDKNKEKVTRLIMKAEGSDWFWWFGDRQDSGNDAFFDRMFRETLKNIYYFCGVDYPDYLDMPIIQSESANENQLQKFFKPEINAKLDKNWDKAYSIRNSENSGVMARTGNFPEQFRYTTYKDNFYFLLEFSSDIEEKDIDRVVFSTDSTQIELKDTHFEYDNNIIEGVIFEKISRIKVDYYGETFISLPGDKFVPVKYSIKDNIEIVRSFDDSIGDDYGPGHYVYPENNIFSEGTFDLTYFEVGKDSKYYYFIAGVENIENIWDGPTGFSLQTLDIYINTTEDSLKTQLLENRGACAAGNYEYAISVEGWKRDLIFYENGEKINKIHALDVWVDKIESNIIIRVSRENFKFSLEEAGFIVAIMGQDGHNLPSRIRNVEKERSEWSFGGAKEHNLGLNIIDIIDKKNQKEILNEKNEAIIPYIY
ncbi:MAG: glucodextranase DOMON-like domain-containing protein [Candidatus Muiribacteriota bacterium]